MLINFNKDSGDAFTETELLAYESESGSVTLTVYSALLTPQENYLKETYFVRVNGIEKFVQDYKHGTEVFNLWVHSINTPL